MKVHIVNKSFALLLEVNTKLLANQLLDLFVKLITLFENYNFLNVIWILRN